MGSKNRVRCIQCGQRVPKTQAFPIYDFGGQLIGYECLECFI